MNFLRERATQIDGLLLNLGGHGTGMSEKAKSLRGHLPEHVQEDILGLISLRSKLAQGWGNSESEEMRQFTVLSGRVISILTTLVGDRPTKNIPILSDKRSVSKSYTEMILECISNPILKDYSNLTGRSIRSEFWIFSAFWFSISVVVLVLDVYFTQLIDYHGKYGPLTTIFSLAMLLPRLALAARRLHDSGKSGVWLLLFFLPLPGWIILAVFFCMDSAPGANKWGSNPKGRESPLRAF